MLRKNRLYKYNISYLRSTKFFKLGDNSDICTDMYLVQMSDHDGLCCYTDMNTEEITEYRDIFKIFYLFMMILQVLSKQKKKCVIHYSDRNLKT